MTLPGQRATWLAALSFAAWISLAAVPALAASPLAPVRPRLTGTGVVVSNQPFSLTSSSASVTGFTYTGNVSVITATVPVLAMRFVAATAGFAGFGVQLPCHAVGQGLSMQLTLSAPSASVATATATTELLLTRLDYRTIDPTLPPPVGGLFTWTPAVPPPTNLLAGDSGVMTSVSATAAAISTPRLDVPHLSRYSSFC